MLSCAGSFVHFAMVKAIFSTERSRTDLFIEDHLHNYSQDYIYPKVNANPFNPCNKYRLVITFHYSDGIVVIHFKERIRLLIFTNS